MELSSRVCVTMELFFPDNWGFPKYWIVIARLEIRIDSVSMIDISVIWVINFQSRRLFTVVGSIGISIIVK